MRENDLLLIGELLAAERIVKHAASSCTDPETDDQLCRAALLIRASIARIDRKNDCKLQPKNEVQK